MAEPAHIDAGNGKDCFGIGDAGGGLDQGDHQCAVILLSHGCNDAAAAIIIMPHAKA